VGGECRKWELPDWDVRVKSPIDPEGFFVKEPTPRAGMVGGFDRSDLTMV
jgi:hypothetical protein